MWAAPMPEAIIMMRIIEASFLANIECNSDRLSAFSIPCLAFICTLREEAEQPSRRSL